MNTITRRFTYNSSEVREICGRLTFRQVGTIYRILGSHRVMKLLNLFLLAFVTAAASLSIINITLSIVEKLVARARKRADALGKSLNQLVRD